MVPTGFRFSVKLPRAITHEGRLLDAARPLGCFIDLIRHLEDRLGALLVQLPPSLIFDAEIAGAFFRQLRVGADPARVPEAAGPGGWADLTYWRLHGSPRMYYSDYSAEFLASLALKVSTSA